MTRCTSDTDCTAGAPGSVPDYTGSVLEHECQRWLREWGDRPVDARAVKTLMQVLGEHYESFHTILRAKAQSLMWVISFDGKHEEEKAYRGCIELIAALECVFDPIKEVESDEQADQGTT